MKRRETEVLVVGAGPAGLAAALAAAGSGAQVTLVDNNPAPGGQIWRDGPGAEQPGAAREQIAAVHKRVRLIPGAAVVAKTGPRELLVETPETHFPIAWQKLIICTGARERFIPFPGWTLPGVTGAGGLQALIKAGYEVSGKRIAIAGSGPLLLAAAHTAKKAGAQVLLVAEQAPLPQLLRFSLRLGRYPGKLAQAVRLRPAHYHAGAWVVRAQGKERLRSISWRDRQQRLHELDCDDLACGWGLVPNTELGALLACQMNAQGEAIATGALQETSMPDIYAAGECTGIGGCELSASKGQVAGLAATGQPVPDRLRRLRRHWGGFASALTGGFALRPELARLAQPDTIVCRCEDVPLASLRELDGWTAAKMASRCGMGPCQGRVCGPAAQVLLGWQHSSVRPPLYPVRVASLADSEATEQV